MIDDDILKAATRLLTFCRERGIKLATAESCTGGLVIAALTEIAGASDVVDRGFITYSNDAKEGMLGVSQQILNVHGAVSAETAAAMAKGALTGSSAHLAVAITGIAGPGASPKKPVGLVYFAANARNGRMLESEQRFGAIGRARIRQKSVLHAFDMLAQLAAGTSGERVDQT